MYEMSVYNYSPQRPCLQQPRLKRCQGDKAVLYLARRNATVLNFRFRNKFCWRLTLSRRFGLCIRLLTYGSNGQRSKA